MHTVTGELRKEPRTFSGSNNSGRWEGFAIDLVEINKDRRTGEKLYTNYQATFFAQSEKMADYLREVLVPGRAVTVSAQKLIVKTFDGQDGKTRVTLEMVDPRIDWSSFSVNNTNAGNNNSGNGGNSNGWGAPQQNRQPAQQNTGSQSSGKPSDPPMDFDDDIPF